MWRNYWTVAVRALAKNQTYSIINIAGLAIGMAACIMILLYVRYEQSYDNWLPDVENTYQLQAWYPHPQDGEPIFSADVGLCRRRTRSRRISRRSSAPVYVLRTRAGDPQGRPGVADARTMLSPTTTS